MKKIMMQRWFVLSVCAMLNGYLLTGISLAASMQPNASEDAQYGEVVKEHSTTPLTELTSPLKPPAPISPSSTEPSSAEKTSPNLDKASANTPTTDTIYSDEDIKTFVEAAKSVDQVKLKYEGQLSKANGQAAIDQIKKEAELALNKTVTDKGMSVAQYNQIHEAALKDPQLLARIQKQL